MSIAAKKYLDPKILDKIGRLELRARLVVEGFVSGMHKSPYRGFSVEFAQHREYVPGDDIRFVDWKVYAKSDRVYIKEFEEETNLRAHIFVDQSESMQYAAEGSMSKFDYAATAAASLAYLIQQQQDSVGLNLFTDRVAKHLPASNTRAQLNLIFKSLEEARPSEKTAVGAVLHAFAEKIAKKGLVIVFSDLFDAPESVLSGLRHVRHQGHDLLVFHILDQDEVEFPFERMTLFEGLEQMPDLLVDPKSLREAYLKEINSFQEKIRKGCLAQRAEYSLVTTDQPLDVALSTYLAARAARFKKRK
jgi:uncharacterized protein (DUF58 family)